MTSRAQVECGEWSLSPKTSTFKFVKRVAWPKKNAPLYSILYIAMLYLHMHPILYIAIFSEKMFSLPSSPGDNCPFKTQLHCHFSGSLPEELHSPACNTCLHLSQHVSPLLHLFSSSSSAINISFLRPGDIFFFWVSPGA